MRRKQLTPNFILSTLLVLTIGTISFGQRAINGNITDAQTGDPLIGATVILNSTGIGTTTDLDGNFRLEVKDDSEVLLVSYTGYANQEISVGTQSQFNIEMSFGELLDEVVVIGYGTIKRDDATGAIQSVNSKDFNRGALTGPQELLAGKVAGVSITTNGDPGGGSKIRIRGESSLNASNDPLIVIDGVPLENGEIAGNRNPLDVINPNDVETFTVLKDASATAIYGNRAAGGVIIITTKKGKSSEKLHLGYNGNLSFGKITNKVDVLDAIEYRDLINNRFGEDSDEAMAMGSANTDWQDQIYQTAIGQEHNINLSGGLKEIPYRLSLGYLNKNGVLKTDNYQRNSIGLNINPGFFNNTLQVNYGLKGIWSKNHFADRGAIGNALAFDPTQEILDSESVYGGYTTWLDPQGIPQFIAPKNPLAQLNQRQDDSKVNRIVMNGSIDYRLPQFPDLRANLNLAYDKTVSNGEVFVPTDAAFEFNALTGGGVNNIYDEQKTNSLLEFYLNYTKNKGQHGFDLMGGYSWQRFQFEESFSNSDVAGTPSTQSAGRNADELFLVSLFGRINYDYNEKLLLTLSLRRDGTSRFSSENRWGLFPAAALAYKILNNENSLFNSLKVRAGWGITGQENIGNRYAYLPQYTLSFDNASYPFGDEQVLTLRPEGYDSQIKWEETSTINLGLDFSIIPDRLSGSLDVYQRDTKDLLNRIPVPAGTNLTNFITTNVGNMQNQGVELSLFLSPLQSKEFSWDLAFNTSYNRNEITKLTASDDPSYQGIQVGGVAGGVGSNIQIHTVGYAPFSFYVKEQLYDEQGNLLEGEFVDRNGDGADNDFYRLEKPAADYSFGLTSNFNYKIFGFSFGARALTGNYVFNNVHTDIGNLKRLVSSQGVLYNIHQVGVDLNIENQNNVTFSDHFVQDASFLRLDHITLSADLSELAPFVNSIYFTIQNPLLMTKYQGLDPEIDDGIDNDVYPRPRTLVFGLSANF